MFNFSLNVYRAGLKQGVIPEVIIGSSPHPFAALAGCCLARRLGCRFILEVRDLWPQALIDMQGLADGHPLVWLMRQVEQRLYLHAGRIIVLARGSIPYLKEKGVAEQRIIHIPNGVHPGHFVPLKTREETRSLFNFNRFTIVYTGAHGPANALNVILEAAGELNGESGVEFVLIGDGPVKPDLQAQARKLQLKNLRFLEPVPKSKIPDLLHAADAGIISLKDAPAFYGAVSPNKFFDYLASGLPVLCTAPGDVAGMVKQSGCGLVSPPDNGKALAEQVRALAALTAEQRALMSARGQRLVLDQFCIPELTVKLLQIINDQWG
ncbi:glycosyltransferase family 4 protein [Desulfotruncus alcoholivorax]|uniref:glycosyltransferase family 4 protein n=1 Tax=Desulfotruncus alcoholivorax TaxID=265477 RepID=UPI00041173D7|nr:glycosyltransferase family 4 protein [Desulfotruncus alcoholivorax]